MVDPRLAGLSRRERRGSRARCVLFTDGPLEIVAGRLARLTSSFAVVNSTKHCWMPQGFAAPDEARLDRAECLLSSDVRKTLRGWWLANEHPLANTPNWDIASTATIDGRDGIILVEAKAHAKELKNEGKVVTKSSDLANHKRIDSCCREASAALSRIQGTWSLSAESHYQLCNRFAMAWKLADFGLPVVLVYLGFLNADEMSDEGPSLKSSVQWDAIVRGHARGIVPSVVWDHSIQVGEVSVRGLIQSVRLDLDGKFFPA